jgi:hypothetical protein
MRQARSNTTDTVLRTLQCLKDQMGEGVSLVSMTTDGPHQGSLTLHLKVKVVHLFITSQLTIN